MHRIVVSACLIVGSTFVWSACSKANEAEAKAAAAGEVAKTLADGKLPTTVAEAKKLAEAAAEVAAAAEARGAERKAPDACAIVSKEALGEALGDTFEDGAPHPNATYQTVSICDYKGAKGASVSIRTELMTVDNHFERTIKYLKGGTAVSGVGDRAYSQVNKQYGIAVRSFLAAKGNLLVGLTLGGLTLDDAAALEAEKTIAAKMLASR